MAYQTIPPSNTSPDWLPRIWTRVKGFNANLTREPVASNCTNINSDMNLGVATGTGAINSLQTIEGSGMEVTSGGTAGGIRVAILGKDAVATTGAMFAVNARTSSYAIYNRFKVVTAPVSGAERLAICCAHDSTNDVGLGILASTSTANWALVSGAAAGSGADSGVAFDTNWNEALLYNNGTNVTLYVNWVQVATAVSSSVFAAAAVVSRTFAYNAAVTGTVNFYMNRWAFFTTEP